MVIDLPHPRPLPLGWQSGRPVGFWVNKHFLLYQFGLSREKNISVRTIETCLSFIAVADTVVSPPAVTVDVFPGAPKHLGHAYRNKWWPGPGQKGCVGATQNLSFPAW